MAEENIRPSAAPDIREELLVRGGVVHGGRDSADRELKVLAEELDALGKDIAVARAVARPDPAGQAGRKQSEPPAPSMHGERVLLGEAAEVLVRPIEPGDALPLEFGLEHLSEMSRYRSFRAPLEHFSTGELEWMTRVDHHGHEALVALDPRSRMIVGMARYVRDRDDRTRAHLRYVVTDAWQRRGVGTALVERLARRASAAGVERFSALVLVDDAPARRLLGRVADEIGEERDGAIVQITGRLRAPASATS